MRAGKGLRGFTALLVMSALLGCVQTTHIRSPYSPLLGAEVPSVAPMPVYAPPYATQVGMPVYAPSSYEKPASGIMPAKSGSKTQSGKRYSCGRNKHCSNITSCEEARYLLKHCGLRRLDRDGDGVPCESLCGGG